MTCNDCDYQFSKRYPFAIGWCWKRSEEPKDLICREFKHKPRSKTADETE